MPRSQLEIAAISNRSGLKSQSASEIAAKIASKSVAKRVEIATEITVAGLSFPGNPLGQGAEKKSKTPSSQYRYKDLTLHDFLVDEKPLIDKCFFSREETVR